MNYLNEALDRLLPAKIPGGEGDNAESAASLLVHQAVRDLCWGTMLYRCKSCGFTWRVFLALGVEGPPSLKRHDLFVPCPFIIRCPAWPNMKTCDGEMSHIDWQKDENFEDPILPGDDEPRFLLPDSGGTCARLHLTAQALVRARRHFNE